MLDGVDAMLLVDTVQQVGGVVLGSYLLDESMWSGNSRAIAV